MQTGRRVLRRRDFDDAAKLPPVFRRITCRADADGIRFLCFKRSRKRGRSVFGERQTIDNELHLVFRFARVKDPTCLVTPARKRIDEIEQTTPRLGRQFFLDYLGADCGDGARSIGIDQGFGSSNLDLSLDWRKPERDLYV